MKTQKEVTIALLGQMMAATDTDLTGLARLSGLSPSTLTRFVKDATKHMLTTTTLDKLSKASGISAGTAAMGQAQARGLPLPPESAAAIGRRMRITRSVMAPKVPDKQLASLLAVPETRLQSLLDGNEEPTLRELQAFHLRMRVTSDFILSGALDGLTTQASAKLLAAHPELADEAEGIAARMDTALDAHKTARRR